MRERPFQDAMDDEVRIAADGRSKMRVLVESKGKVAERIGGVACLLKRAQHEIREDALFGLAGDFSNEPLIMLRCDAQIARGERDSHPTLAAFAIRVGTASLRGRGDTPMAHGNFALV